MSIEVIKSPRAYTYRSSCPGCSRRQEALFSGDTASPVVRESEPPDVGCYQSRGTSDKSTLASISTRSGRSPRHSHAPDVGPRLEALFSGTLRCLMLAWAVVPVVPTVAQPDFGTVSLVSGQTVRLNVIAVAAAGPVGAKLSFVNAAGTPLTSTILAASLAPYSLDLNSVSLGLSQGQQLEVQPVVSLISPADQMASALATVEVLDTATSRSLAEITAVPASAPGTTPLFGLHGIGTGQTLRLNVAAHSNRAVRGQLSFRTFPPIRGKPSLSINLAPGRAVSLDLDPTVVGTQTGGQRLEVQPVVTLPDSTVACTATVEIFNANMAEAAVQATPSITSTQPSFGMIGLVQNQSLRLNIVASSSGPATGQMAFVDAGGTQIAAQPFVLAADQAALPFDLNASQFGLQKGQRVQVHPVVTVNPPAQCLATTELFDSSTGASLLEMGATAPPTPGVAPIFGMHGVAFGQVLRLNYSALPGSSSRVTLSFNSTTTGQPFGPAPLSLTLNPGQSGFLDFDAKALGLAIGQRIEVRPVVQLQDSVSAGMATVEVIDATSGRTMAWAPPTVPTLAILTDAGLGISSPAPGPMQVTWTLSSAGFVLESSPDPSAPAWTAVTNASAVMPRSYLVPLVPSRPQQFFRLRK